MKRTVNWRQYGGTELWPNLRYYPGICVEERGGIPRGSQSSDFSAEIWVWDISSCSVGYALALSIYYDSGTSRLPVCSARAMSIDYSSSLK